MRRMLLGLAGILVLCSGCDATHLVYVQEMNLGIDVSYSTEGTGHLVLGYDRQNFTLAPKKHLSGNDDDSDDLMSLAAVSCVSAAGLNEIDFNHFVSTGDAAVALMQDPEGRDLVRGAIFKGTDCHTAATAPKETPE